MVSMAGSGTAPELGSRWKSVRVKRAGLPGLSVGREDLGMGWD